MGASSSRPSTSSDEDSMGASCSHPSTSSDDYEPDKKKRKTLPQDLEAPFLTECEMALEGTPWQTLYADCKKNEGHKNFVEVKEFLSVDEDNISPTLHKMVPERSDHRSTRYPNEKEFKAIQDYVRVLSPITNKVTTKYTSHARPDVFPGTESPYPFCEYKGSESRSRYATGTLLTPLILVSENSSHSNCHEPEYPNKKYWLGLVLTATHAVCDLDEAKHSTFEFFYDEEDSPNNEEIKTLKGTGLTVSEFIGYYNQYRQDQSVPDNHRRLLEINSYLLSNLKHTAKHRFASDMNVIVCKTEDEETATRLSDAWIDWINYKPSQSTKSAFILFDEFPPIVSHPHGASKKVSIGCKSDYKEVSVRDCINNNNIYLESHYKDQGQVNRRCVRLYVVDSNTGHDLFPIFSDLYPPSPFDEDSDLVGDADTVTIPARTEVQLLDDSNSYSLRRNAIIPRESLILFFGGIKTSSNSMSNTESGFTSTNTHTDTHKDRRTDTPVKTRANTNINTHTDTQNDRRTDTPVKTRANTNINSHTDTSTNRHADTHDDRQFSIMYKAASNTSSDLLPVESRVFTPVPLDKTHLVKGTDLLRLPAKTRVWIVEGLSVIKYSLRKDINITKDSLLVCGNTYFTYNTPTCPGSSGACLPYLLFFLDGSTVSSHSGAYRDGKNKSGITVL